MIGIFIRPFCHDWGTDFKAGVSPPTAMDLVVLLGRNVRNARLGKRMTQEALALDADMKRSYLSELEAGKRNPTVKALGRLAKALEMEAADLLRSVPVDSFN